MSTDSNLIQIVIRRSLSQRYIYSIISCDYMGFIWSDLTVDGYNYTCTVYLGSLELFKKKKERDTHKLKCMMAALMFRSCLMHHWCLFRNEIYRLLELHQPYMSNIYTYKSLKNIVILDSMFKFCFSFLHQYFLNCYIYNCRRFP